MQIGVTSRRLILLDPRARGARYLVGNLFHEQVRLFRTSAAGRDKRRAPTPHARANQSHQRPASRASGTRGLPARCRAPQPQVTAGYGTPADEFPIHERVSPESPTPSTAIRVTAAATWCSGSRRQTRPRRAPSVLWGHRPRISPEPGKPGRADSSLHEALRDAHRREMVERHGQLEYLEGGPRRRAPHPLRSRPTEAASWSSHPRVGGRAIS